MSKKWEKRLEISSFNTSVPKIMIICYIAPEIWHMADVIVIFHFGLFLSYYHHPPPLQQTEKWKFENNEKNTWRYHHFTQMYQKPWLYAILFLRYMVRDRCNCYFSFGSIFCSFAIQKIKISKKLTYKKNTWRYHFTHVYQKLWLDDVRFLRHGARRTGRREKWHIWVGAPPEKKTILRIECNSLWDEKNEL